MSAADVLPTWSALCVRCWTLIVQWFTPLAPSCLDCGFPIARIPYPLRPTKWWKRQAMVWGDGRGRCLECAQLVADAEELARSVRVRDTMAAMRATGRLPEYAWLDDIDSPDIVYVPHNDTHYVRRGTQWSSLERTYRGEVIRVRQQNEMLTIAAMYEAMQARAAVTVFASGITEP